ncbi:hypothetical protein G7Z17_g7210 [Cylindrodendrum hubeiense]|uniref:Uncharacterized protein n=1 Tax=Cylindrodendrum hubeiense TaxID=595255 RepID=A0A9P5H3D8_9HYPO|nr:hypothetical protein G7Z17_g7210 [Cylindrodendrum hubeiense]
MQAIYAPKLVEHGVLRAQRHIHQNPRFWVGGQGPLGNICLAWDRPCETGPRRTQEDRKRSQERGHTARALRPLGTRWKVREEQAGISGLLPFAGICWDMLGFAAEARCWSVAGYESSARSPESSRAARVTSQRAAHLQQHHWRKNE